ncbi:MAG TPA: CaiB/BaiF CoA-transferase family protein [Rhizomicrobium sp.]|jgi:crotonobetainyl-CoA:carnitine CoA-transferase CaiB-like acyl-CoA transferase
MTEPLFKDLLVLDCASFVAGPAAATIMSDFGARVIKIEPPGTGDSYRQLIHLPGTPASERDYYWMLDNRNKESLALDLKQDAAQEILRALVQKADVFVTNFPGPIRERLKLRAGDILSLNERIIYASLTPYGEEGPEKDRTGYDSTAWWARSGLMHAVRPTAQSEPARSIPAMGDHPTAVALYAAIMTGLYRRSLTGKGGIVSTSLLANGLWSNGSYMQAALVGATFQPRAPRYNRSALLEVYRCRDDRWFMFSMVNQVREWPLLLQVIERPEWETDPRFATAPARQQNAETMVRMMEDIFAREDWEHWRQKFMGAGVTVGPITRPEDHFDCPQVAANDLLPEFADEPGLRTIDNPIRVADAPHVTPHHAPRIGQHSESILRELGFSSEMIEQLTFSGTVGRD